MVDGDTPVHRFATGAMTPRTVIPIASASKWLTTATLMTFVDEGKLALDDPVARYLPGLRRRQGRHHRPPTAVAPERAAVGGV